MPVAVREIVWRKSAAGALVDAAASGDDIELGRRVRKSGLPRVEKSSSRTTPLLWQPLWSQSAFESTARSDAMSELLLRLGKTGRKPVRKSLLRLADGVAEHLAEYEEAGPDPFELLGWLTILVHCQPLPDGLLGRLWRDTAGWVGPILDGTYVDEGVSLTDDQQVLVEGELPSLCGAVFSDLRGSRRCATRGAKALRKALKTCCDADGTPHASLLERLPLWLAPFVRAAGFAKATGDEWIDKAGRTRFRKTVERCAALCRSNGETALSNGAVSGPVSMLRTACEVAGLGTGHAAVQFLGSVKDDSDELARGAGSSRTMRMERTATRSGGGSGRSKRKDLPASQSDESELACLRNNWGPGEDSCVLAFDGEMPRIDLTAFGVSWAKGSWEAETLIDGQRATGGRDWRCCCWCSDGDADYAELQTKLNDETTLLRQVLLSRTDHFVLLVDIVQSTGDAARGLQHSMRLPLVRGSEPTADALTREWAIDRGRLRLRLFPLGLEQDSVNRAAGRLAVDEEGIVLTQEASGSAVVCPLFVDFSPARRKKGVAWGRVTVAEDGSILPVCDAYASRLRVGDHQWLYLHNLTRGETARTVLGMHTFHETVIGEVTAQGEVEPIMQVEA